MPKVTKTKANTVSTPDLNLAAYLLTCGYSLSGFERVPPTNRGVFTFDIGAADAEKLKTEFFSGKGEVSALKFAESIKNLKNRLFA